MARSVSSSESGIVGWGMRYDVSLSPLSQLSSRLSHTCPRPPARGEAFPPGCAFEEESHKPQRAHQATPQPDSRPSEGERLRHACPWSPLRPQGCLPVPPQGEAICCHLSACCAFPKARMKRASAASHHTGKRLREPLFLFHSPPRHAVLDTLLSPPLPSPSRSAGLCCLDTARPPPSLPLGCSIAKNT